MGKEGEPIHVGVKRAKLERRAGTWRSLAETGFVIGFAGLFALGVNRIRRGRLTKRARR